MLVAFCCGHRGGRGGGGGVGHCAVQLKAIGALQGSLWCNGALRLESLFEGKAKADVKVGVWRRKKVDGTSKCYDCKVATRLPASRPQSRLHSSVSISE
jgi:hypothetical protein